MEIVRYGAGDREVNRCTNCYGLFFKPIDLKRLKNTYKAEIIDHGSARKGREHNKVEDINCPVCDTQMEKEADPDQSHIWYESCPKGHGVYFDAGELTDLSQDTFMDVIKGLFTGKRS
jgi:Zn-finger nucleic acid-binding protein